MRDPTEQLHRIQNAIIKITEYAKKGRPKFDTEEEIQLSVIYYLQTISEAANAIPQNFKAHQTCVFLVLLRVVKLMLLAISIYW